MRWSSIAPCRLRLDSSVEDSDDNGRISKGSVDCNVIQGLPSVRQSYDRYVPLLRIKEIGWVNLEVFHRNCKIWFRIFDILVFCQRITNLKELQGCWHFIAK